MFIILTQHQTISVIFCLGRKVVGASVPGRTSLFTTLQTNTLSALPSSSVLSSGDVTLEVPTENPISTKHFKTSTVEPQGFKESQDFKEPSNITDKKVYEGIQLSLVKVIKSMKFKFMILSGLT